MYVCIAASYGQETYMKIENNTPVFKTEAVSKGHSDATEILGLSFEVAAPRDVATGQASGKRQYPPLTIFKESGASSPQFVDAVTKNTAIKKIIIEVYRLDATFRGTQTLGTVITLENITVSNFRDQLGALNGNKNSDRIKQTVLYDEIKFIYEKITIEDKIGNTKAQDSWDNNK